MQRAIKRYLHTIIPIEDIKRVFEKGMKIYNTAIVTRLTVWRSLNAIFIRHEPLLHALNRSRTAEKQFRNRSDWET